MIFKKIKSLITENNKINLTQEELNYANKQYQKRVSDFSKKFSDEVSSIEGSNLQVYDNTTLKNSKLVALEKEKHYKIIQQLQTWDKSVDDLPFRIIKTWKSKPTACSDCKDMANTAIDVTSLFIGNLTDEVYEVQSGGLHEGCECIVRYEIEPNS